MQSISNKLKKTYMRIAVEFSNMSCCKRLKVGAVAVKNGTILAHGWNGTPSGYHTNVCELPNGETNAFTLHAEENILIKMAKSTESLNGASIFCTYSPCAGCAKLLAQTGISEFYFMHEYRDTAGLDCLSLLGVKIIQMEEMVEERDFIIKEIMPQEPLFE